MNRMQFRYHFAELGSSKMMGRREDCPMPPMPPIRVANRTRTVKDQGFIAEVETADSGGARVRGLLVVEKEEWVLSGLFQLVACPVLGRSRIFRFEGCFWAFYLRFIARQSVTIW